MGLQSATTTPSLRVFWPQVTTRTKTLMHRSLLRRAGRRALLLRPSLRPLHLRLSRVSQAAATMPFPGTEEDRRTLRTAGRRAIHPTRTLVIRVHHRTHLRAPPTQTASYKGVVSRLQTPTRLQRLLQEAAWHC